MVSSSVGSESKSNQWDEGESGSMDISMDESSSRSSSWSNTYSDSTASDEEEPIPQTAEPAAASSPTPTPTLTPSPTPTPTPTPTTSTPTPTTTTTPTPTSNPTKATKAKRTLSPTPILTPKVTTTAKVAPAPTPIQSTTPIPTTAPFSNSNSASAPASNWPTSQGRVELSSAYTVNSNQTFDGGLKTYDRSNVVCDESKTIVSEDAIFIVQPGGVLQNVILSANHIAGVVCISQDCVLENIWVEDVCQAAVVVSTGVGSTIVTGGGAKSASKRVILSESGGSVSVEGFYVEDAGELFESCGTCGPVQRTIEISNVISVNPSAALVRVNENYKDKATISNVTIYTSSSFDVCALYEGGLDPEQVGTGQSGAVCQYSNINTVETSVDR